VGKSHVRTLVQVPRLMSLELTLHEHIQEYARSIIMLRERLDKRY